MSNKSVITGDIINSRNIQNMDTLISELKITFSIIQKNILTKPSILEIYRGDSFQILIHEAKHALRIAFIIKCRLKSLSLEIKSENQKKNADARISIGIGTVRETENKISESQGEAFELSGLELDKISHNKLNLSIKTNDEYLNNIFAVNCLFANHLSNNWSSKTSESIYRYLLFQETQEQQAKALQTSQPNINKRMNKYGNIDAINAFIRLFEEEINS